MTAMGSLMFFITRLGLVLSEDSTVTVPTPSSRWNRLRLVEISRMRYSRISSSFTFRKPLDVNSRSSESRYRVKLRGSPKTRFRSCHR